jgi:hypothetical protein
MPKSCGPRKRAERLFALLHEEYMPCVAIDCRDDEAQMQRDAKEEIAREFRRAERRGARRALREAAAELRKIVGAPYSFAADVVEDMARKGGGRG